MISLIFIIVSSFFKIYIQWGQKNSVETTCLILRFPRLHFQQVVPRRNTRRFAYLFLKVRPELDYCGKLSIKNTANRYFICLILCLLALFFHLCHIQ